MKQTLEVGKHYETTCGQVTFDFAIFRKDKTHEVYGVSMLGGDLLGVMRYNEFGDERYWITDETDGRHCIVDPMVEVESKGWV